MIDSMKKLRNWVLGVGSAIIIGLIVALIDTPLASWIRDLFTKKHILTTIWNWICEFSALKVSIWWVIGIIIIAIAAMYIERKYYTAPEVTTNNREINVPQFVKEYTQDNFGSYIYRWKWLRRPFIDNNWYMTDLRQYCPHDNTPLDHQVCPRCNGVFPAGGHPKQIEALVADNIKKKYGNENISPLGGPHIYIIG